MGQTWNATLIVVHWSGKLLAGSCNAAKTFRSWIRYIPDRGQSNALKFQWGHNLLVMDTGLGFLRRG